MMLLWLLGLIVTVVLFALVIRVAVAIIRVSLAVLTAIAFALVAMALAGLDPSNDPQSFIGTFLLGLLPALWLTFRVRRESKNVAQPRLTRMGDVPLQALGKPGPEARIDAKLLDRLDAAGRVGRWVGRSRRDAATNRKLAVAWGILEQVGEGHRARIAVAKTGCERLLALAGTDLVSPSALDALIGIRKGVPELTEKCVRHMMSVADASGRSRAISQVT